jgi:hypothetical protein
MIYLRHQKIKLKQHQMKWGISIKIKEWGKESRLLHSLGSSKEIGEIKVQEVAFKFKLEFQEFGKHQQQEMASFDSIDHTHANQMKAK